MGKRDPHPRQQNSRSAEERIAEIQHELVTGGACADAVPETWKIVEEELLDELAELELFLLTGETGPYVHPRLTSGRRQGRQRT